MLHEQTQILCGMCLMSNYPKVSKVVLFGCMISSHSWYCCNFCKYPSNHLLMSNCDRIPQYFPKINKLRTSELKFVSNLWIYIPHKVLWHNMLDQWVHHSILQMKYNFRSPQNHSNCKIQIAHRVECQDHKLSNGIVLHKNHVCISSSMQLENQ